MIFSIEDNLYVIFDGWDSFNNQVKKKNKQA